MISTSPHFLGRVLLFCSISGYFCLATAKVSIEEFNANPTETCKNLLSEEIINSIKGYQNDANKIIEAIMSGEWKGRLLKNMAAFTEKYGSRITGSETLEVTTNVLVAKMKDYGLENVKSEDVPLEIPYWARGEEKLTLLTPRKKNMQILGIGYTMATPPGGITAPVIVVRDWDDLKSKASQIPGKIVAFNQIHANYSYSAGYRLHSAVEAAKLGAKAVLVRSVANFSLNSPHTGMGDFVPDPERVPAACITIEDAQFLWNLQANGEPIEVHLQLESTFTKEYKTLRNIMGENVGKAQPENMVIIGCHLDSWDVGDGAMDDASGCFLAMEALALLNKLGLKAKRSLRAILFTAEEEGYYGCKKYVEAHPDQVGKISFVVEADWGMFQPKGLNLCGSQEAACVLKEILSLMKGINATNIERLGSCAGDLGAFSDKGIPVAEVMVNKEKYFWYHHTQADVAGNMNAEEMDTALAIGAVVSYVVADLGIDLPRDTV